MEHKISIRFFNDCEARAIWDDAGNRWLFSVLDVLGVLNRQEDYAKTCNYWKYLKNKLKKDAPQLVSATNQLKLTAADDKKYSTDVMDSDRIVQFAKNLLKNRFKTVMDILFFQAKSISFKGMAAAKSVMK